jgi:heptosyltransferase-2
MAAAKILVLGPAWVGDMVLAQSLFKTLKAEQPGATIDVAAPAWTLPLLERMPEINKAIGLPFKHGQLALAERIRFGRSLKNKGYTQAILLTNSFKSAVLPFAAGIPRRSGFLGEYRYGLLNDIRALDTSRLPRTVDRFITLGLAPDAELPSSIAEPKLITNIENALQALQKLGHAAPETKVLGLCPGAEYGEAKRWPAEHYAEVANEALKHGWEVWLFGSDKDIPVTAQINRLTAMQCLDLGGKTKLGEAIDLMSLVSAFVSNDSGLMHIAAALGKPLVAIYGSSDPRHTPPMNAQATILYLGLECSPCFKRECPLTDPAAHLACLRNISPGMAISQLKFTTQ